MIVRTPHLQITNGAVIDTGTANNQLGGDIVIEADQVSAIGGRQVIATTADWASLDDESNDVALP